jgi:FkbM family methyltransferase
MNISFRRFCTKYFTSYGLSKIFSDKHNLLINHKLDIINLDFIEKISGFFDVKKLISDFHYINLGAAHASLPPVVKALISNGAKALLIDASDNFFSDDDGIYIINKVVHSEKKKTTFHLINPDDCSSLFEPDFNLTGSYVFLSHIKPHKIIEVETTTLKEVLGNLPFAFSPAYLAMDLQGGELEALKGTPEHLFNNLHVIVSEVAFKPLYKDAPLFNDINDFLRTKNFEFIDISPIRAAHHSSLFNQSDYKKFQLGAQQLYCDMIYMSKKDVQSQQEAFNRMLSLLIEYRYSEMYELVQNHSDLFNNELISPLQSLFINIKQIFPKY